MRKRRKTDKVVESGKEKRKKKSTKQVEVKNETRREKQSRGRANERKC